MNIGVVTETFDIAEKIKSVSFVAKTSCRAIQAADLLAFYSRRHANELLRAAPQERAKLMVDPGQMLKIIAENLPHRSFVANGFRIRALIRGIGDRRRCGRKVARSKYTTVTVISFRRPPFLPWITEGS